MKRVAMELQVKSALEKDPAMDYMLLQGVRFAFRIHQVCPGIYFQNPMQSELHDVASLLLSKV